MIHYISSTIGLLFLLTIQPSPVWHETDWSKHLAEQKGGIAEFRLPDASRVDILTENVAWEVEWCDKWSESFGQALFYAASTDREPGIILLMRGKSADKHYLRCLTVVNGLRQHMPFRLEFVYTDK